MDISPKWIFLQKAAQTQDINTRGVLKCYILSNLMEKLTEGNKPLFIPRLVDDKLEIIKDCGRRELRAPKPQMIGKVVNDCDTRIRAVGVGNIVNDICVVSTRFSGPSKAQQFGTGFVISPHIIITTAHTFYNDKRWAEFVYVAFSAGSYKTTLVPEYWFIHPSEPKTGEKSKKDLAILCFKKELWMPSFSFEYLSTEKKPLGIMVHLTGYPSDIYKKNKLPAEPILIDSLACITEYSDGYLNHTCDTGPGSSGSPLWHIDTHNGEDVCKVVGMHVGSNAGSTNYAIPISTENIEDLIYTSGIVYLQWDMDKFCVGVDNKSLEQKLKEIEWKTLTENIRTSEAKFARCELRCYQKQIHSESSSEDAIKKMNYDIGEIKSILRGLISPGICKELHLSSAGFETASYYRFNHSEILSIASNLRYGVRLASITVYFSNVVKGLTVCYEISNGPKRTFVEGDHVGNSVSLILDKDEYIETITVEYCMVIDRIVIETNKKHKLEAGGPGGKKIINLHPHESVIYFTGDFNIAGEFNGCLSRFGFYN
jgi:V8-like Glu-specific endopeptidase